MTFTLIIPLMYWIITGNDWSDYFHNIGDIEIDKNQ